MSRNSSSGIEIIKWKADFIFTLPLCTSRLNNKPVIEQAIHLNSVSSGSGFLSTKLMFGRPPVLIVCRTQAEKSHQRFSKEKQPQFSYGLH